MGTLTSTETDRLVNYTVGSSASTGPFAITFPFADSDDVAVYVNGTKISTYAVTQGNAYGTSGNFVTLQSGVTNSTVTVASEASAVRLTTDSLTLNGLNGEVDNIYANLQENQFDKTRSLNVPVTDATSVDMTLPNIDARKGKVLGFNSSSGNPEATQQITGAAVNVTNLSVGSSANASVSVSSGTATFAFGIPAGAAGSEGSDGATGPQGATGATGADGGTNIVSDTTPQLGGNLSVNGKKITSESNTPIQIEPANNTLEIEASTIKFTNTDDGVLGPFFYMWHDSDSNDPADYNTGMIMQATRDGQSTPYNSAIIAARTPSTSSSSTAKLEFSVDRHGTMYDYLILNSDDEKIELLKNTEVTGNITVSGTVDGVDLQILNNAVTTNTAKTSNATHTGEVTGSGALTIADNVVDEANLKVSNTPTNGQVLSAQSGNSGGLTWVDAGGYTLPTAAASTLGGVKIGSNLSIDGSGVLSATDTNTTYSIGDGGLTTNDFTDADHSKLNNIAVSANNYVHPNHTGDVTSTADGATVVESNVIDADNLKVTGNGTTSQFLRSDGDGTFTWATPTDTDTVYTHPNHSGEVTSTADGATVVASNVIDADNLKVTGNGSASQFLRSDGDGTFTWATPTDTNTVYTHPT